MVKKRHSRSKTYCCYSASHKHTITMPRRHSTFSNSVKDLEEAILSFGGNTPLPSYTPTTENTLGNLIGVCFDSRGGWDTHARQLLNALFHRDLGWSSENSRLWLKRRLVRKISSVIWLHNGKMLEKALSWELTRKSKGNNTDSSAGSQSRRRSLTPPPELV